nr:transmembrane protein 217 [Pogona vitticeps]
MVSSEQAVVGFRERMILLCGGGFCGMVPKVGSTMAGIYMILMNNLYMIFEIGHLNRSMSLLERVEPDPTIGVGWVIPYYYYAALALATITYPLSIYFISSVCKEDTVGIFIYLGWIVFYDISNCVIVTLTSQAAKTAGFSIHFLEWVSVLIKITLDCFWIPFIITYAFLILEVRQTETNRRRSRKNSVPPRFRLHARGRME